jgi:hypothetical protein
MAKQGEQSESARALQVRGTVDVEKFKAARTLAGDRATFELRAISPNRGGTAEARISCIVCLICIICVVCAAARAEEFGIPDLPALRE